MPERRPGLSVRLKLTLSYAGFLMIAGVLLLAIVWLFLLRYVPDREIVGAGFVPNRSDLIEAFAPRAVAVLAFLLVFGLAGGWRKAYVICAAVALYLNIFVGVVQAFQKVPALKALAPTQSEPPFAIAQLLVLALFTSVAVTGWLKWRSQAPPMRLAQRAGA